MNPATVTPTLAPAPRTRRRVLRLPRERLPAEHVPRLLLYLPLACILLVLASGLLLGLVSARPRSFVGYLPLQRILPLHTLGALASAWSGIALLALAQAGMLGLGPEPWVRRAVGLVLALFPLAAGASVLCGFGSGKEYTSWWPALGLLPLLAFVLLALALYPKRAGLVAASPESAWLLGLGLVCIPLGLVEAGFSSFTDLTPARELSFDWQGLDLLFAGTNAALYGLGLRLADARPKPLRTLWLYVIAAFTFVSTFGHHHYASPQPESIKRIAVTASMLAGLSFVRHLRAHLRSSARPEHGPLLPFLLAAERWTLVAVGSGILLAIPRVNTLLHGTYAIVAHSMCAWVGVNVMLVLGGVAWCIGLREPRRVRRLRSAVRWANRGLFLLWLELLAAGLVKGWLRLEGRALAHEPRLVHLLEPLPLTGLALALPLGWIVVELWLAARRQAGREPTLIVLGRREA